MTQIAEDLYKAQYGEDKLLWKMFNGRHNGFFIEVGAWNGISLSNTYFLEQMGWTGILIEPLREQYEACVINRPRSRVVHAACTAPEQGDTIKFTQVIGNEMLSCIHPEPAHAQRCLDEGRQFQEIEVPAVTLDQLIVNERKCPWQGNGPFIANVGWQIDLVSIDVEGGEMDVLRGFNLERFRPQVLLIECNLPSGSAVAKHLQGSGYKLVHRQVINDFYVRQDCIKQ